MACRIIIARPHGDTWTGVGVHSGGPPSEVGADLLDLHTEKFAGDVDAMVAHFILEHPYGWFGMNKPVVWNTDHPERTVDALTCTCPAPDSECQPLHYEWAYVLAPPGIFVYKSVPAPDAPTTEQLLADAQAGRPINMDSLMSFVHQPLGLVPWGDHTAMNQIGATDQ